MPREFREHLHSHSRMRAPRPVRHANTIKNPFFESVVARRRVGRCWLPSQGCNFRRRDLVRLRAKSSWSDRGAAGCELLAQGAAADCWLRSGMTELVRSDPLYRWPFSVYPADGFPLRIPTLERSLQSVIGSGDGNKKHPHPPFLTGRSAPSAPFELRGRALELSGATARAIAACKG